jgi:hypothetical protein
MSCYIQHQIALHANANTCEELRAEREEELNNKAAKELMVSGVAEFSNGEIEMYEAIDVLMLEKELAGSLIESLVMGDLSKLNELRSAVKGAAEILNLSRGSNH